MALSWIGGRAAAQQEASPVEQKIRAALSDPTTLEFIETPLKDVVDYLKDLHGMEIQFDHKALDAAGVSSDTPVTRNLKGVRLCSALKLMLRDLELTYVVRDDVLQITSREALTSDIRLQAHTVVDIAHDDGSQSALLTAVAMALDPPPPMPAGPRLAEAPQPRVTLVRGVLVVRGHPLEHEQVADLLSRIRQELKQPAPKPLVPPMPEEPRVRKPLGGPDRPPAVERDPFGP
jgi:hypothetical protein